MNAIKIVEVSYDGLTIEPDGMYLVEWPDGSKRLLFGKRIIISPVSTGAKITKLVSA